MSDLVSQSGIQLQSVVASASKRLHPSSYIDVQYEFKFVNGYSASVICGQATFGTFELAVLDRDGGLDYTTPITDDVIRLSEDEIVGTPLEIAALLPKQDTKNVESAEAS